MKSDWKKTRQSKQTSVDRIDHYIIIASISSSLPFGLFCNARLAQHHPDKTSDTSRTNYQSADWQIERVIVSREPVQQRVVGGEEWRGEHPQCVVKRDGEGSGDHGHAEELVVQRLPLATGRTILL